MRDDCLQALLFDLRRGGPQVGVLGQGRLPAAVASALSEEAPAATAKVSIDRLAPTCSALVVVGSEWSRQGCLDIRRACAGPGVPWLLIRTEPGKVIIGPTEQPGGTGCATCAEARRRLGRLPAPERTAAGDGWLVEPPSLRLGALCSSTVAALVIDELHRLTGGTAPLRTRTALLYVDVRDLFVDVHHFLADPLCPDCGSLPPDEPDRARIELQPRPKRSPEADRAQSISTEWARLLANYVDEETGLVRALTRARVMGLAVAAARGGWDGQLVEVGFGQSTDQHSAEMTALLEAMERYGGGAARGKRTVTVASYAAVQDKAVAPWTLGLHSTEQYDLAGFPFTRLDDTSVLRWVWGYSFALRAPILVPESCAYFGRGSTRKDPDRFVYETSNGCALGGCLEEAILHGLLEVIERDASLMTWYARMPLPRIDLASSQDRTIPLYAEIIRGRAGYEVCVFDSTLEQGIPCVWTMAVNRTGDATRPKAVCASGSHLDPERAALGAMFELGSFLGSLEYRYPLERAQARRLAEDPSLVTAMEDHSLLYGDPAAFGRFDFLFEQPRVRGFEEAFAPSRPRIRNADLRDDLIEVIQRQLDAGLDVIVVDQTTPEHRCCELVCVKVIVPGLLPMTFGHNNRRLYGLRRPYEMPYVLGYRDYPLQPHEFNPHPHPFM